MRINEQDLRWIVNSVLKEYHQNQQLMLPFDGNSEPYNYMQFMEWLEEYGTYGKLPSQPGAMKELLTPDVLYNMGRSTFYYGTGEELDTDGLAEAFIKFVGENKDAQILTDASLDVNDIAYGNDIYCPEDFSTYLTEEGYKKWKGYITWIGDEAMKWWISERLDINEDGLIYCERAIDMERARDRYHGGEDKDEDYYQTLKDNYGGIGVYWSYAPGGGCVYFYTAANPQTILVKGHVSPKDVDWDTTISLDSMEEQELRVNQNAIIQIDEITMWDEEAGGNVRLPLRGSLLMRAN